MNTTVYLFGEFNSGYSQYPEDYTSEIFGKFNENAKSTTQIVIHRDGNLMYYGYIRKLEQDCYIGLCVVLNGLLLTRIDGLFSLFEHTISGLVTNGQLIHFNEQGEIVTKVEKLYVNKEEVDLLNESLRAGFNHFINDITALPPVRFGISKDSVNNFVVDDDLNDIIESSHSNGYTFIYKSKGFNTAQMNSYKGVLARVSSEKKYLQRRLEKLQIEYDKVLRQKKQFKFIMILVVILIACAIGLFFLNDTLSLTRDALLNANDTIGMQNDSIHNQSIQILSLLKNIEELEQKLQAENVLRIEAERDLDSLRKKISERQPFFVKKTSFDYSTGILSFDYYGMSDETVTINARVYNDFGLVLSTNSNIHIKLGDNSDSIDISSRINESKGCSFEILKDNVILGGYIQ